MLPPLENNLQETNVVQKSKPLFSLWKSELTLSEFKILDTYLSRIDSHKPEQREVIFEKGELEKLLNVKKINKPDLEQRLVHLQKTTVNIGNGKNVDTITLFERSQATQDEYGIWQVRLTCTPSAMKYIFNVEKLGYLRYQIRCITSIKSLYSYIMFTYLEYNRFRKSWEVPLGELKDILNCTEPYYDEFSRFKEKILNRCHKELTEKTDMRYTYAPVKKGTRVVAIHFELETLPEIELPDTDPEQISLFSDESLDFLGAACVPGTNEQCEFAEEDMAQLREVLMVMPDSKLPTNVPNGDIQFRRYHYLSERYAALNAAAIRAEKQGKPIKNRFAYLLAMVKKDAGIE